MTAVKNTIILKEPMLCASALAFYLKIVCVAK